jgi:hypothetical protein
MSETCKTCRKPKANFHCGLCAEAVCKNCAEFLEETSFSFLTKVPKELTHTCYCPTCFDEKVSAPLAQYNGTLEKAREIMVFSKDQTKLTGHLKRKEEPYRVENCEDQEEALMRMSFYAVQGNFNTLLDVEYKSKKIIVGSHKKTIWDATAIPITIDPKEVREDS